jgi:hypothetical protein
MSDFDTVLERLLVDPSFQARLADDPNAALAGYALTDDERELLRAQVTGDTGGNQQVEQRTSKASLFGLLSPMAGVGGLGDAAAHAANSPSGHGLGQAPGVQGLSGGHQHGISAHDLHQSLDQAPKGGGGLPADDERGALLGRNLQDFGHDPAGRGGLGPAPIDDYRTRVDVEGDGKWDAHTYAARQDGGVDIVVDANRDGNAEFVGVDHDRDGLIDESFVDYNSDGQIDAHYVDVNKDGWLDKKVPIEQGQGTYVSRHAAEPDDDGISAAQ